MGERPSVLRTLLPEPPGRDPHQLGKDPGVIVGIAEAHAQGNVRNGGLGTHQEVLGSFHPHLVDVGIDVDVKPFPENVADVGLAAMAEACQLRDADR